MLMRSAMMRMTSVSFLGNMIHEEFQADLFIIGRSSAGPQEHTAD